MPTEWEKPPYQDINTIRVKEREACLTLEDLKTMIRNQLMCENARRGLVELIKADGGT